MEKVLILFRGIPGAGKTTAAELLSNGEHVYSADNYFYKHGTTEGKYEFDATKLHQAHLECQEGVKDAMRNNKSKIFVANTLTTQKEINTYSKIAEKYNYKLVSLIVENRHGNLSVHNVPSETIKRMYDRFSIKLK